MWFRVIGALTVLLFGPGCMVLEARSSSGQAFSSYRAYRRGESVYIGTLHTSVWRPLKGSGPWPLVIFSHGKGGSGTQSSFLMSAMADHGYLVIAPDHRDAHTLAGRGESEGFLKADEWTDQRYRDRADDIKNLIRSLKADPAWSRKIDWSEMALAGHSLGGYTVLGLAGAWPSWKIPGVKAVLAMSPYCSPFLASGHLERIDVPVMYQGGTRDLGITPSVSRQGGAFDRTRSPAYYVEFEGAGHLAWTDLQPSFQSAIDVSSLAFLDRYVKGDTSVDPRQRTAAVSDLRVK